LPYGEVDRIAKMVPAQLNITLDEALKQAPQLASTIEGDARYKDMMEVAKRLEGLARHASTHAAGVVISPEPLTNLVPLYKSNRDEITTQYDMKGLEHIGLLKMDFLGLTTLTVLEDTVHMIEQNRAVKVDLNSLPLDDEATYNFPI
jgi:DNA polymerase III subunit alpha